MEIVQPLHRRRRAGITIAIVAATVIAAATLTPSSDQYSSPGLCVVCGELGGVDLILNAVLFAPLGLGLALAGVRPTRAILSMCAATIVIEAAQVWLPGRDASLGDVIANSVGGSAGWLVGAHASTWLWPRDSVARRLAMLWLAMWLVTQAASGYALHPSPAPGTYYGRVGRATRSDPPYAGRILVAKLNATAIPNMSLPKTSPAFAALRRGSNFTAELTVVPGPSVQWLSPIVRIVDHRDSEILLAAARQSDFIFGVRTGAATLRLRPAYFRLAGVFHGDHVLPEPLVGDPVHLQATYASPRIELSADERGERRTSVTELTASSGWRLFTPFQTYSDGSLGDDLLNALWLAALLFPVGYWAIGAGARGTTIWITVLLGIGLGLAIGPLVFHLGVSVWTEALGTVTGAVLGMGAARALRRSMRGDDKVILRASAVRAP